MTRSATLTLLLALSACGNGPTAAPEAVSEVVSQPGAAQSSPDVSPDRAGAYMGRTLATTMSHLGADWLTRDNRDEEENTTLMHNNLGLEPGDVACDFGAGNGYHTLRMAAAVVPGGKAIGVDLQPQMLALLGQRAQAQGVSNIETIVAESSDPKLPPGTCDLILLVDVYHELSDPAAVLARLSAALTDRGRVVLLEYRAEDPTVPIKALHKMSKEQIVAEYTANGLRLASAFDGLPWQHMMFFVPTARAQ